MIVLLVYKKSIVLIGIFFFLVSCSNKPEKVVPPSIKNNMQMKIGFGSCLKQDNSMQIFTPIKAEKPDLFLMIGDNVYGDSEKEDLKELRSAYATQKKNFERMNFNFPIEAIWDDHDYGMNDAGVEYPYKEKSKELFLNFWDIPSDDVRRFREGLYFDLTYNINHKILQILFLDTRTFRDSLLPTDNIGERGKERYIPNSDSSLTILGESQWSWFKEKISERVDLRIIVSSIQVLPIGHGWESWNNFPLERQKMIDMIDEAGVNQTLILSGDRHRAGIYKVRTASGKIIAEVTSSSLNASFPNKEENGPLRIGNTFVEENYGVIIVDGERSKMTASIKNIKGEIVSRIMVNN